ncbi:MAG: outer membrane lipoprotein-sorting protein [Treponema sp.]
MIRVKKIIAVFAFCLAGAEIFAENSTILERIDAYRSFSANGFSFDYAVKEKDDESTMTVYVKSGDESSVITVYKKPAKLSGRRIFVENSLFWLFDSNMRAPIRISAQQMLSGQASAGDITNITFSKLYNIVSQTEQDGFTVLELEAKLKRNGNYQKIVLKTQGENYKPVSADLYASTGVKLKTINYDSYSISGGKEMLTSFSIANSLNNSVTKIEMSNFSEKTLPDRYFSREGIKNLK